MNKTPISHTMVNADELAGEFCEILNLSELYGDLVNCASEPVVPTAPIYIDFSTGSAANTGTMEGVTPVFTRASTATVSDYEGIARECLVDEARFAGARRVYNYLPNPNNCTLNYYGVLAAPLDASTVQMQAGESYYYKITPGALIVKGRFLVASVVLSTDTPGTIGLRIWTGAGFYKAISIDTTPKRYSIGFQISGSAANEAMRLGIENRSFTGADGLARNIIATNWQIEDLAGSANRVPSERVDGFLYTTTENANTVAPVTYIVTEAEGAAITGEIGYLNEDTATNYFLNATAPVTQTITGRTGSHVCWLVGTGSCTLSGGLSGTVTEGSPVTGDPGGVDVICTIAGSVDRVQFEGGTTPTSFIPTSGAPEIRARDVLKYDNTVIIPSDHTTLVHFTPLEVISNKTPVAGQGYPVAKFTSSTIWNNEINAAGTKHSFDIDEVIANSEAKLIMRGEQVGGNVAMAIFHNGALKDQASVAGTLVFSSIDGLVVGSTTSSANQLPGIYYGVSIYTSALLDSECITLSTVGA